jgi:hypothetical protein
VCIYQRWWIIPTAWPVRILLDILG